MTTTLTAEVVATVAILSLVFAIFRWAVAVRKADMAEIRSLSEKDMATVLHMRSDDMNEIRGSLADNKNGIEGLGLKMDSLNEKVAIQNSRVSKLETWTGDHQKEDDRQHAEFGVVRERQDGVLQKLAAMEVRTSPAKSRRGGSGR